jgi:hypothetical protein
MREVLEESGDDVCMREGLEGSGHGVVQVCPVNSLEAQCKNTKSRQASHCSVRELNRALHRSKCRAFFAPTKLPLVALSN